MLNKTTKLSKTKKKILNFIIFALIATALIQVYPAIQQLYAFHFIPYEQAELEQLENDIELSWASLTNNKLGVDVKIQNCTFNLKYQLRTQCHKPQDTIWIERQIDLRHLVSVRPIIGIGNYDSIRFTHKTSESKKLLEYTDLLHSQYNQREINKNFKAIQPLDANALELYQFDEKAQAFSNWTKSSNTQTWGYLYSCNGAKKVQRIPIYSLDVYVKRSGIPKSRDIRNLSSRLKKHHRYCKRESKNGLSISPIS